MKRLTRFSLVLLALAFGAAGLRAGCIQATQVQILFGSQVDANGCLVIYQKPVEVLPDGFLKAYGPRPDFKNFRGDSSAWQDTTITWEQNLRLFAGLNSDYAVPGNVAAAYVRYNYGEVLFVNLQKPEGMVVVAKITGDLTIDFPPDAVLKYPNLVISALQMQAIADGRVVQNPTPLVQATLEANKHGNSGVFGRLLRIVKRPPRKSVARR